MSTNAEILADICLKEAARRHGKYFDVDGILKDLKQKEVKSGISHIAKGSDQGNQSLELQAVS